MSDIPPTLEAKVQNRKYHISRDPCPTIALPHIALTTWLALYMSPIYCSEEERRNAIRLFFPCCLLGREVRVDLSVEVTKGGVAISSQWT